MFKTSPLVPLGLGLLLVACENPTAPDPNAALGPTDATPAELNTWSTKASILAARIFGVAGAQNNIVYFVGGKDTGGNAIKTVMAYTHRDQLLGLQGLPAQEPELGQRGELPQRQALGLRRNE